MNIDLKGKRVLVTGGNSGLGAAMARAFADEGAHVAINYLVRPEETEALVKTFTARGGKALGLLADVSDAGAVEAMFAQAGRRVGRDRRPGQQRRHRRPPCQGLGQRPRGLGARSSTINLNGAYLCAPPGAEAHGCAAIRRDPQHLSVHEVIAWTGYSAYTASKAGLSMMSKSLAQEAAPHGVRVLCIAPGAIQTADQPGGLEDPEGMKDLLSKIPLGRVGTPEDIAGMAVVLASDVAGYMTGATVFVDGGMTDYPEFAHGG